jgi:hypothetical protein
VEIAKFLQRENNMALKLFYYGQNIGNTVPNVVLTGNPALDQPTLSNAGYLGGKIMAITGVSAVGAAAGSGSIPVIIPAVGDTGNNPPFGTLINDPGEFSGSIGPSGSGKAPVVRALWFGAVDSVAFDTTDTYTLGGYVYLGGAAHTTTGQYTGVGHAGTAAIKVGICTSLPGAASFYGPGSYQYGGTNNWLGVASLL